MRRKLAILLSRLGLICLGLLTGLIMLEIGFRILYPDPSPRLVNQGLQSHNVYQLAFTPGAEGWNTSLRGEYSTYVKINNKGLRGQEYPYEKPEGVFRVLILGDSFAAGLQVEESQTFSKLLEARLNQHAAPASFEVINSGVVGYGTDNQLAYFSHEGYKYQPDLVILSFFAGNDITDNIWHPLYELNEGRLAPVAVTPQLDSLSPGWAREGGFFRSARTFLYTHSRLYSVSIELLVFSTIRRIPALVQFLTSMGLIELTQPALNYGNIYAFRYLPDQAWETTEAILEQLKREVEARNSQLLVAILPDETDVDEQRRQEILNQYAHLIKAETLQGPPPTEHLAELLDRNGIAYVQLLPALKDYHRRASQPLYYRYDGHWTPTGHQIAAQAIYDYLIENRAEIKQFPGS